MVLIIEKINRRYLLTFIFILTFAFCLSFIGAVTQIDINVNAVFNEGEEIRFSYSILSDKDETINYTYGIKCESIPEALLDLKQLSLKENQSYSGNYSYGSLQDIFPAQNCTAYVSILEPYQFSASKPFVILAKTNLFYFDVDTCKDELCIQKVKVFVRSQDMHLSYNSSVEDLVIHAFLKYPNGNIQTLSLPISIKAEQIGTYEIEVRASKEGYKNMTVKKQFGVIEKEPNIKIENESDIIMNDSFSSEEGLGENDSLAIEKNFSSSEAEEKINEESDYNRWVILLVFIMIITLIIFLFVIYKIKLKKYKARDLVKHQAEKMNDFNKEKIDELLRRRGWIR